MIIHSIVATYALTVLLDVFASLRVYTSECSMLRLICRANSLKIAYIRVINDLSQYEFSYWTLSQKHLIAGQKIVCSGTLRIHGEFWLCKFNTIE